MDMLGSKRPSSSSPPTKSFLRSTDRQTDRQNDHFYVICRILGAWFYRVDGISDLQKDFNWPGIKGWCLMKMVIRGAQKTMWTQGTGRNDLQDIINFGLGNLKALSDFLGEFIASQLSPS